MRLNELEILQLFFELRIVEFVVNNVRHFDLGHFELVVFSIGKLHLRSFILEIGDIRDLDLWEFELVIFNIGNLDFRSFKLEFSDFWDIYFWEVDAAQCICDLQKYYLLLEKQFSLYEQVLSGISYLEIFKKFSKLSPSGHRQV